jgi:hypothetical protein
MGLEYYITWDQSSDKIENPSSPYPRAIFTSTRGSASHGIASRFPLFYLSRMQLLKSM